MLADLPGTRNTFVLDTQEFAGCCLSEQTIYSIWWTDDIEEPLQYLTCCATRDQAKRLIAQHSKSEIAFGSFLNIVTAHTSIRRVERSDEDGSIILDFNRTRLYLVTNQQVDLLKPEFQPQDDWLTQRPQSYF